MEAVPLSVCTKIKHDEVVLHEEIGIGDSASAVITGESTADYKNEIHVGFNVDQQHQLKDALPPNGLLDSNANHSLENDALVNTLKSSEPDSMDLGYSGENDYDEDDYEEYEYDAELIDTDFNYNLASKFDDMDLPPGVEATVPWLVPSAEESTSIRKPKEVIDQIDIKFKAFKQFDTVHDTSDHYYAQKGSKAVNRPASMEWAKRIQHEWKILENDLPETIFVRACEDRMDLLRAVIVGPAGTPYHDGLFFFDVQFPPTYPNDPPAVYYHSGGLRLNPNLYDTGYVCLSLLGTWHGKGCEKWSPSESTMLQVLVSIQALVLNEKPYFNEPGYESSSKTAHGEMRSLKYNESTFVLSCKTMLYSLRRPPKHFEDFVDGHFRKRGRTILAACKAYMDGVRVGCDIKDEDDDDDGGGKGDKSLTPTFTSSLQKLFEDLLMEFTVKGADCDKFLAQKVKAGVTAAAKAEAT